MRKNKHITQSFKLFDKRYYTTGGYDDYLFRYQKEGEEYARIVIKTLNPLPNWKFLDVGCGMGGLILALRKLGYETWGTEVSPYALKYSPAKQWVYRAKISLLPFATQQFEVVTTFDVLCYVPKSKLRSAIKELCRVAKHYLVIETIDKNSPNADQKHNPDELRTPNCLHTPSEIKRYCFNNHFVFIRELFPTKEIIDFNGVFRRVES